MSLRNLEECKLEGSRDPGWGDCPALALRDVQQIHVTQGAVAAILAHGSIAAWGEPGCSPALAAVLADGSVVTWRFPDRGGDCSAVQHQLKNVVQQATEEAVAAILAKCFSASVGQSRRWR